jgi:hypothetical protein
LPVLCETLFWAHLKKQKQNQEMGVFLSFLRLLSGLGQFCRFFMWFHNLVRCVCKHGQRETTWCPRPEQGSQGADHPWSRGSCIPTERCGLAHPTWKNPIILMRMQVSGRWWECSSTVKNVFLGSRRGEGAGKPRFLFCKHCFLGDLHWVAHGQV